MTTADFRINLSTTANREPDAVRLADGRIVVAWTSGIGDADAFFRLYDSGGIGLTDERRLHPSSVKTEQAPALAALEDGGFLAVWHRLESQGGKDGIVAQRFDHDGNAVGLDFAVSAGTAGTLAQPAAAGLVDGGFIVTWTAPDDHGNGVFQQRFSAFGAKIGGAVAVNTTTLGSQRESDVAALNDGGWVVAFTDQSGVTCKIFDAGGLVVLPDTRVDNLATVSAKENPRISVLSDGNFVITWTDNSKGGVHARLFAADGVPKGGEFRINGLPDTGNGDHDVTALEDGGFVISWRSALDGLDLFQRFDAAGAAIGPTGTSLSSPGGIRLDPVALASLGDGGWITFGTAPDSSGQSQLIGAVRGQASDLNDYDVLTQPGEFDAMAGDDVVVGSVGTDLIRGQAGADVLYGESGDDILLGGLEGDRIHGGQGADIVLAGSGDDFVWGDSENDIIRGGSGNDTLDGGKDKDRISGGEGDDVIIGGGREDVLRGGNGDDTIRGDNGIDRIDGGSGNDLLRGGQGADVFLFHSRKFGEDIILDFQDGLDRLHVKGLVGGMGGITVEQNGTDAILTFGGGELIMRGMSGLVDATDFVF